MTTVSQYYLDRANRGAKWLDQHFPGWDGRVNTPTLDISDPHNCVIGQLCGNYNDWKDTVKDEFAVTHGLFVRHVKDRNWEKQTAAWRQVIEARQTAMAI